MAAGASAASGATLTTTLERRLGVRKRAREDAAANRPRADEAGPCAFELEIAAAIAAEVDPLLAERREVATALEHDLRRRMAPAPDFSLMAAKALLPLQQIETRHRAELNALRARARAERSDVETFRRREDRVFGAKLPDSSLLSTGLLVTLMAVEAMASAPIFASVNSTGLVNGYLTAIIMSGLNAVIGLFGGFFGVRYTTHSRGGLKAMGYGAALLSVVVAIGFNMFMAIWRASGAEPADSADATPALALLANGPSVTLILLGGIVYLMSLYEGATRFGEPYPEYGKMERHAQAAEEEFRDLLDEVIEELHDIANPVIADINTRLDEHQEQVSRMLEAYDTAAARLIDLGARQRMFASVHTALVALYRKENIAHRKGPSPRAFLTPPEAPAAAPDLLERAGAMITVAKEEFARAQAGANKEIAALVRELRDIAARLEGDGP